MISKVLPSPVQQPIVLYFVVLTDQKLVESTGTEDNENDYNNFILFLAKHTLRSIFSDLIVCVFLSSQIISWLTFQVLKAERE